MNPSTQSDNTVTNASASPQEVELKMALGRDSVDALMAHPLLEGTPPETHRLANVYYDTPELDLEAHRVALRLRGNGETFVQTVKTAGDGHGGLHTRGEWETPREEESLDLEWLAGLGVTPFEDSRVCQALVPVYRTDFQRTQWLLEHDESWIELALDIGEIVVGERRIGIHEIELELKEGRETALWSLAEQLAHHCALRPANASKAARAASLREQQWQLPACALDMPGQCLERAILALDAFQDSQQQAFLYASRQALIHLTRHDDFEVATLAGRLGESLSRPDWLSVRSGQQWLLLMQRLYR
ncbi:CYTH domain-containing protein [Kushneria sp. TE3]|uniref:CYTH domain-containing protein n=1 Tax=Kushneria sp. TE3 TaxID=3449832 RepID=UPI003F6831F3